MVAAVGGELNLHRTLHDRLCFRAGGRLAVETRRGGQAESAEAEPIKGEGHLRGVMQTVDRGWRGGSFGAAKVW